MEATHQSFGLIYGPHAIITIYDLSLHDEIHVSIHVRLRANLADKLAARTP